MELLRIDPATQIAGIRVNVFTSVLVGLGAVVYFVISARTHPGARSPMPCGVSPQVRDQFRRVPDAVDRPAEARDHWPTPVRRFFDRCPAGLLHS